MSDLKTRFDEAVNYIQTAEGDFKPSNEMKLEFYALYKQAILESSAYTRVLASDKVFG